MIEWRDEGVVLALRNHGETSVITEVFTQSHGRHAGIVRGGISRRIAPGLQPGGQVSLIWKARMEDHLGSFTVEPLRSRMALVMADRLALEGLNAVTGLLALVLPERDPHPRIYATSVALLDLLGDSALWPLAYLQWELALLEEMGFGLDLSCCAVTGAVDGLVHVSPRSGRAVTAAGAGEWGGRMLPLPPVMLGQGEAGAPDIAAALSTTGYFITHRLLPGSGGRTMPAARARFIELLLRAG